MKDSDRLQKEEEKMQLHVVINPKCKLNHRACIQNIKYCKIVSFSFLFLTFFMQCHWTPIYRNQNCIETQNFIL